jgi:hypothetical protein
MVDVSEISRDVEAINRMTLLVSNAAIRDVQEVVPIPNDKLQLHLIHALLKQVLFLEEEVDRLRSKDW